MSVVRDISTAPQRGIYNLEIGNQQLFRTHFGHIVDVLLDWLENGIQERKCFNQSFGIPRMPAFRISRMPEEGIEPREMLLAAGEANPGPALRVSGAALLALLLVATAALTVLSAGSGIGFSKVGQRTNFDILPKDQWAKVYQVTDVNSTLAGQRYYEYTHHSEFLKQKANLSKTVHWQIAHRCPKIRLNVEMRTSRSLPSVSASTANQCQKSCTETSTCVAFTWNPSSANTSCTRHAATSGEQVRARPAAGSTGGLPCAQDAAAVWWPTQEMDYFQLPQVPEEASAPHPNIRMLCLAVFRPWTKEQELLEMQYKLGTGIFACDQYAVYSSTALEIVPGLVSRRVSSTLMDELGGPYITVLNLGSFMAVWRQVFLDGEYLKHDWTIKADPDTVFIKQRLQPLLQMYSIGVGPNGRYLNNCRMVCTARWRFFHSRHF